MDGDRRIRRFKVSLSCVKRGGRKKVREGKDWDTQIHQPAVRGRRIHTEMPTYT